MLDNGTKKRIDDCRDILVGKVPDPKSQVEQITIALIYKFMDDMDKLAEELGGKTKFFTGDFAKYSWSKIFDPRLSGYELITLYGEAIDKMNINPNIPQLFRDIFKNAYLPYRDPETLKSFLKTINEFHYDHSEKLGDAYEYLLSVLSSQGDAGQFRTPRHIIDFIVDVVDPKKNDLILDPACGTAGFLISSYKHILEANTKNKIGDKLSPDNRTKLMNNVVGYDISPDMVRLSLVNMYLHGFTTPLIYEYDTLTSEERWNENYDVIMANPPFMSPKGGIKPHKRFSIQANRSEVLFADYILEHLTPNGRAGFIVPEGIIFQSSNAYKKLRKTLVENNYLWAVVSLPAGVFNPYAGVKTSILFIDKTLAKQTENILFVKIVNDGFDLGAQRRHIDKNDLPEALKVLKEYKTVCHSALARLSDRQDAESGKAEELDSRLRGNDNGNVLIVPKQKIAESSDYNFSVERYKETIARIEYKWNMVKLSSVVEVLDFKRKPITKSERKEGPYPYYGATGIVDYVDDYLFDERLVLVGEDGAKWNSGEKTAFIAVGKYWVNNHAHVLKPQNDKIIDTLLVELLNQMDLNKYITGVTVPKLNQEKLRNINIPLPPLEIQQQIVTELDSYQKIIDGAKQIVANYKPTIKIEPDWEMVGLYEIFKLSSGKGLTRQNMKNGIYPVYGGNGINGYHNEYFIEEPIIVIGRVGEYCGVVHITQPKCWISDNALYVTKYLKEINQKYLAQILSQLHLNQYSKVGGQPSISQTTIYELQIPLPSLKIQQEIVSHIEEEQKLVDANKRLIEIYEQKIKDKIKEVWGE